MRKPIAITVKTLPIAPVWQSDNVGNMSSEDYTGQHKITSSASDQNENIEGH